MKKICFVVSSPITAIAFLLPHLKRLSLKYEVHVFAQTLDKDVLRKQGLDIDVQNIPLERVIRPTADIRALLRLFWVFRAHRFDVVHSVTPKAGLLAMTAGWMARVPVRIHVFTGQVWATRVGFRRVLLKAADCMTSFFSTKILVDSPSQLDFLVSEGVVEESKSTVLGRGSISGVDTERFRPDEQAAAEVRGELGIPEGALVLVYVGRMNAEKGIAELALAFASLARTSSNLWLLLVGPDESGVWEQVKSICAECANRIVRVDFTNQPQRYMAAGDIFCLPSYREGFGSSVIEAAACGVPAVASKIYGLTDAVEDGKTGLLTKVRDADALCVAVRRLIENKELRLQMSCAARLRAKESFSEASVVEGLAKFYESLF